MSVSHRQPESGYWKPTSDEISELLVSLEISPPQSFDESFFPTSTISDRNSNCRGSTDLDDNADPCDSSPGRSLGPTKENFDRNIAIERLRIVRENAISIKLKNNLFHEHLVEHFERKQMMHVYTDESEDDVLLNEYLKKLDDLERSKSKVEKCRYDWDREIARTRVEIGAKKQDARDAVNEMISEERAVGASAASWHCGKPTALKRVQSLITRQLDRIRDIATFRLRYTRLRDELITRQVELRVIAISKPNLTKQDYERLVAEQHYYKRQLNDKHERCEILTKRRNRLTNLMASSRRRISSTRREINECKTTIDRLRRRVTDELMKKNIFLDNMINVKCFVRDYDEVIGQTARPEFAKAVANIRQDHDEWIKKISKTLKDIEALDSSLNAVRASLILHGKHFDRITALHE